MNQVVKSSLLSAFAESLVSPFQGSISQWCNKYITLPEVYSMPGILDLSLSPYLAQPLDDFLNPDIRSVHLSMARRIGKTLITECFIAYSLVERPGPIMRVHQSDQAADQSTKTKLLPIFKQCPLIAPMLPKHPYTKEKLINFGHTFLKITGAHENPAASTGARYLVMDEAALYELGLMEKFIGRTDDFAGNRKIIVCSTPNHAGSELYNYYNLGQIYEWHWQCPNPDCCKFQPWQWSKEREDGTYSGINWETILLPDGETNIAASASTAVLECFHCKHQVADNVTNRELLNATGKYICIKQDGDPAARAYQCPAFVNVKLSLQSFVVEYLNAKKLRNLNIHENMVTFVTEKLGRFYKEEQRLDVSKIMRGDYKIEVTTPLDKDYVRLMAVDVQRKGTVKYYVIRDWKKTGNESKRIAFGICRDWKELSDIAEKWNVQPVCVGVDSGDGPNTTEIYQQCVLHGKLVNINGVRDWACWAALKGDKAMSYQHKDGARRLYKERGAGDPVFPMNHKLKGIPAPLYLWSNYSIKSILMKLRDNQVPGVKWMVDSFDADYEMQMQSEGLMDVIDKKTGMTIQRWMQIGEHNHFLDAEAQNLVMAIRAQVFSAVEVDESMLLKVIPKDDSVKK